MCVSRSLIVGGRTVTGSEHEILSKIPPKRQSRPAARIGLAASIYNDAHAPPPLARPRRLAGGPGHALRPDRTDSRAALRRDGVADDRPVPRRARARRQRRARPLGSLLFRRRGRRRLAFAERRRDLDADLRRPAARLDRRAGGRPVGPARDLRRLGRSGHAVGHLVRRRHVPIERRRRHVDGDRPRRRAADRQDPRRPAQPGRRPRRRPRPRLRGEPGARRLSIDRRRAQLEPDALQGRRHRRDRAGGRSRPTSGRSTPRSGT